MRFKYKLIEKDFSSFIAKKKSLRNPSCYMGSTNTRSDPSLLLNHDNSLWELGLLGFKIRSTSTSLPLSILLVEVPKLVPPSTWIFMLWPILVILMVLLFVVVDDDLLEGMADVPELEVLDFSSLPELVPSDWESEESTREKERKIKYIPNWFSSCTWYSRSVYKMLILVSIFYFYSDCLKYRLGR